MQQIQLAEFKGKINGRICARSIQSIPDADLYFPCIRGNILYGVQIHSKEELIRYLDLGIDFITCKLGIEK